MLIGKFKLMHDEEYIARSFEMLGHDVIRVEQEQDQSNIHRKIVLQRPDILIFTKWQYNKMIEDAFKRSKEWNMKIVCWLFDLFVGYEREFRIMTASYFKADYVVTTDGGHSEKWIEYHVNHHLVRQGIYAKECQIYAKQDPRAIVFIGSENPFYPERTAMMVKLMAKYSNFKWIGRLNTNTVRGLELNELYSKTKIVVGDSVYSPHYWSNRIVETLGRGGFLIHRDVPGLKEEYPDLVTYDGTFEDLCEKIDYYSVNEEERQVIIQKNFELVQSKYTMDKKCQELLDAITS